MRKSDSITVALGKIKDRYKVIQEAYYLRTKELSDLLAGIKSTKSKEKQEIGYILDKKLDFCNEILIQLQNWLDDVQSLEVVNNLESRINELYNQSKKEISIIEKLQMLIKDFIKIQPGMVLIKDLSREIDMETQIFEKSVIETKQKSVEINNILFNKKKLLDSLAEYI